MTEIISWFEKFSQEFSFLSKGCTTWIYIQRHLHLCSECSCSAVSVWHTCDTCSIVERASFSRKSRGGGPKLQGNRKYCTEKKNNKWILNFIGNIYIFIIGSKNIRSCIDDSVNNIFAQNLKFLKLLLKVQENYLFLPNVLNWKKSPIFSVEFPPWSFSGNGNWVRSWRGSQSVETAPVNREILID